MAQLADRVAGVGIPGWFLLLLSVFIGSFLGTVIRRLPEGRPIMMSARSACEACGARLAPRDLRSEEHTSELQSRFDLVCRLLLEIKNRPRKVWLTVPTMSSNSSSRVRTRTCGLAALWPTSSHGPATRKPVATMPSGVAGCNTSPA